MRNVATTPELEIRRLKRAIAHAFQIMLERGQAPEIRAYLYQYVDNATLEQVQRDRQMGITSPNETYGDL